MKRSVIVLTVVTFIAAGMRLLPQSYTPRPVLIVGYDPLGAKLIPIIAGLPSGPGTPFQPPQMVAYGYNPTTNKYYPLPVDPNGNLIISASSLAAFIYGVGGGTAQAQTLSLVPAVIAPLVAGLTVEWTPVATNTATAPTLAVNATTATVITKCGGQPLNANDLPATIALVIYSAAGTWELQNPAFGCPVNYAYTQLQSPVAMSSAFTWYTGPTIALTAGTWALDGNCAISGTPVSPNTYQCRFFNVTSSAVIQPQGGNEYYVATSAQVSVPMPPGVVTLPSAATVALQSFALTGGNTLVSGYTTIRAVRLQ